MTVRYTRPALADLDEILTYIEARSPQGARRVQARIRAVIDLLVRHPLIGRRTDDPAIRRMLASPFPYLIFHEVTEAVIIHALRHAVRDPAGMPGAT